MIKWLSMKENNTDSKLEHKLEPIKTRTRELLDLVSRLNLRTIQYRKKF